MSEFSNLMASGLAEAESVIGEAATLNGAAITGVFSEIGAEDIPEFGGSIGEGDATFIVRKSIHSGEPKTGDKLIRAGKRYKVTKVSDGTENWTLILEGPSQ